LKDADLLSCHDIKNLGRSVATSCDIFSVVTEANTADNTLVLKGVKQINIENSWNFWVEDGEPIRLYLLLVRWQTFQVQFGKSISNSELRMLAWHGVTNLG
jgi:hypothetical protein